MSIKSKSSSLTTVTSTPLHHHHVRFSTVEIREYAMVLGEASSMLEGPPVAIGWDYQSSWSLDLDSYETERPPRRIKDELVMPAGIRVAM